MKCEHTANAHFNHVDTFHTCHMFGDCTEFKSDFAYFYFLNLNLNNSENCDQDYSFGTQALHPYGPYRLLNGKNEKLIRNFQNNFGLWVITKKYQKRYHIRLDCNFSQSAIQNFCKLDEVESAES